jgi:hypothetical protein
MEDGGKFQSVEIKSGETVLSSWFDNLTWFKKVTGDENRSLKIIYGGDRTTSRKGVDLIPWREFSGKVFE